MTTRVSSLYIPDRTTVYLRPLFLVPVSAGYPSPADDYLEGKLDLNAYLIKHPAATFYVRAKGDSMIEASIHPGDVLIVDRALHPGNNSVVIAVVNGELTVKRLCTKGGGDCVCCQAMASICHCRLMKRRSSRSGGW